MVDHEPLEGANKGISSRSDVANDLATSELGMYADNLGMQISDGETNEAFRNRVAGELRARGQIIEAHEVSQGRRWDDADQRGISPLTGIIGAVAQTMQGIKYSPADPERQVGYDLAAGIYLGIPEDPAVKVIGTIFETLGPKAGMDLIEAMHKAGQK